MDRKEGVANLVCRVCDQRYQSKVNRKWPLFLTKPGPVTPWLIHFRLNWAHWYILRVDRCCRCCTTWGTSPSLCRINKPWCRPSSRLWKWWRMKSPSSSTGRRSLDFKWFLYHNYLSETLVIQHNPMRVEVTLAVVTLHFIYKCDISPSFIYPSGYSTLRISHLTRSLIIAFSWRRRHDELDQHKSSLSVSLFDAMHASLV